MNVERLDTERLIHRLTEARIAGPAGLAFDADGTLWSGDVGEDVYRYACNHRLIRDEPASLLFAEAQAHGLDASGPPSAVAEALFRGYLSGVVDERRICELMALCYAGYDREGLVRIARAALTEAAIVTRKRQDLAPVLAWARAEGLRVVVISASPAIVVEEALALAGIEVSAVAGARLVEARGLMIPELAEPIPYAEQKVERGQKLLAGHDWLAAFGDNLFDLNMLHRSRRAVAVFPKAALEARLPELPWVGVLD